MKLNPANLFSRISLDFSDFEENWDSYISKPILLNSERVYKTIPMYDSYEDEKKIRVSNKIDIDIITLEKYVLTDILDAAKITFKLLSITDGSVSESIDTILGMYIHVNPLNFLKGLESHFHLVTLSKVLGNYGLDFVDEFELKNIETQKRIDALNSVSVKYLESLNDKCIKQLKTNFISQEIINDLNRMNNFKGPIV